MNNFFENLEKNIIKIKKKANPKVVGVAIFMCFGVALLFGMEMSNNFKRQKDLVQDNYNRSLYEIVGYAKNVEVSLAKAQITSTQNMTIQTLASIWKQSNLAKQNLELLPVKQEAMSNAAKYLAQVSDFSYSLMRQQLNGEKITEEQYSQIKNIYLQSMKLTNVLDDIYDKLSTGRIKWDEVQKAGNQDLSDSVDSASAANLGSISKTFKEYEGLIYDGAFSDHLLSDKPKSLPQEIVTSDQAKENIEKIFGKENIKYLELIGESDGRISLYNYKMKLNNKKEYYNIDMTKNGGRIYLMISDRQVSESKISVEEAEKISLDFLKKLGIENMKSTYYLTMDNMTTINFAAMQGDVMLYPDLIKVKVALDNGDICSIETQGYTFNHIKREKLTPKISLEQAKSIINKNIKIDHERLCIIPTESKNEILAYEFKGSIEKQIFLIYVNATTGNEENILLLLETENGILTM